MTLREEYKRMLGQVQLSIEELSQAEKDMVGEYSALPDLAALQQEIETVAARLEMMVEGNPGLIRAFEKRKDDILKTQEKLGEHAANLEDAKEKIVEIRQQWEPQLDALISKISDAFAHNFEQIGCAGEVSVYKDEEDFDRWSIQISVRFRYVSFPVAIATDANDPTVRAKRFPSSTLTASLVASAPSQQYSTSWPCKI